MSADGFDDILIEVARVAQEASGNIECVLQTGEDVAREGELRALSELAVLHVNVLHPAMVSCCR